MDEVIAIEIIRRETFGLIFECNALAGQDSILAPILPVASTLPIDLDVQLYLRVYIYLLSGN